MEALKSLYIFEYKTLSTGESSQIGVEGITEAEARAKAAERAADYDFTDVKDIELGKLLSTRILDGSVHRCEGCES